MPVVDGLERQSVYLRLRAAISNCEFRPGQHLNILELADRFDVSATPIREALNRLVEEELVIFVRRKGFFCKPLSLKELAELCDALELFLDYAIIVACTEADNSSRLRPAQSRTPLRSISAPLNGSAADIESVEACILDLVAAGRNDVVMHFTKNVVLRIHFAFCLAFNNDRSRAAAILNTFNELKQVIAARDIRRAREIIRLEINATKELLPSLVREATIRAYSEQTKPVALPRRLCILDFIE